MATSEMEKAWNAATEKLRAIDIRTAKEHAAAQARKAAHEEAARKREVDLLSAQSADEE